MLEVVARAGEEYITLRDGKNSVDVGSEDLARVLAEMLMAMLATTTGNDFPLPEEYKPN